MNSREETDTRGNKRFGGKRWLDWLLGPRGAPYLFVAPFFLLFLGFFVFPVLWSVMLSFQQWSAGGSTWVGLSNYIFVLRSPEVIRSFGNIAWYLVVNNVFQLSIALPIAVLLDFHFLRRINGLLRMAYFMPNIVSGVVAAILFAIILGTGGLLDSMLERIGIGAVSMLQSPEWAKTAVVLTGGWRWIGYWIVLIMAGLQSIPDEMYEVADLEGASHWQRFRYITFPLLRPVLLFVIVVNSMGTMQIFEEPFLLFDRPGGPLGAATTPVVEIYSLGFQKFDLGSAAALSWLLAACIIAISIAQFVLLRRRGWSE
jgi:lactose/L-arabinose transport system permease protein